MTEDLIAVESSRRRPVRSLLLGVIGLALVLAGGFAHGRLTQRWGPQNQLVEAAKTLDAFPKQIGNWVLVEARSLETAVIETLQCANYVAGWYQDAESGKSVSMAMIVGPSGPTAVHNPEICFSSRDYRTTRGPEVVSLKAGADDATFWRIDFQSQTPGEPKLSVYYAWADDGTWIASPNPRFEFAATPFLYKLQFSATSASPSESADDTCREFARALLASGWKPALPNDKADLLRRDST